MRAKIGMGICVAALAFASVAPVGASPPPANGGTGNGAPGVPAQNGGSKGPANGGTANGAPGAPAQPGISLTLVHLPTWNEMSLEKKVAYLKDAYDAERAKVAALEKRVEALEAQRQQMNHQLEAVKQLQDQMAQRLNADRIRH